MLTLPAELMPLFAHFAPLFSRSVWQYAQVLLAGAILAIGKRTVTACLRVMGKSGEKHFQNYHRVLNRACWSVLEGSRLLLRLLVVTFMPEGDLIFGLDDTIERRRGQQIKARGIYRDPVRSSHSHFVKASGLRWLCCMFLPIIPWAYSVWGLPFLSVLCPSERYYAQQGRIHRKLTDRAWQMIQLVARWLPGRALVFVADSSFAVLDLLYRVSLMTRVSLITRLRMDAQLYEPAPKRKSGQMGRPRLKGKRKPSPEQVLRDPHTPWRKLVVKSWYGESSREVEIYSETAIWYKTGHQPVPIRWVLVRDPRGKFAPQALLSTNLHHTAEQILTYFIRRWRMEVSFEETRTHLGIETQRQWNDQAIARTTPVLMGLFSLITLAANLLIRKADRPVRKAAWYTKTKPTFADAIALVRSCLWSHCHFSTSYNLTEVLKIPRSLFERLTDTLCYAT